MSCRERIERYNAGRDPERLALKYEKMAVDELAFFRGTSHLFYEDFPADRELLGAPAAWLCGDLHLENFGTYRADNRLTYFDINDFDESCLGPASLDLARLLTSVAITCAERRYKRGETRALCGQVAEAFAAEMRAGKPRWTERETARGLIRELFDGLKERTSEKFLRSRTRMEGRRRRIDVENGKALAASKREREALGAFFEKQGRFRMVDAARRIAGNGSLGVPRYVVLAEDEKGNPYLLDLKHAQAAAPVLWGRVGAQPGWRDNAERVVKTQALMLAMPPAFLEAVVFRGEGWVLRELLPSEDRVDVAGATEGEFVAFAGTLGAMTAWAMLRASGRRGAENGDALVAWEVPVGRLVEFAMDYSRVVARDFREFRKG